MFYNIVVLCSLEHTQMLVNELQEQCTAQYSGIAYVTDQGYSWTKRHGFLVIEWLAEDLDETLLTQLAHDERITDLCPYTLPTEEETANLFGYIVAQESREARL